MIDIRLLPPKSLSPTTGVGAPLSRLVSLRAELINSHMLPDITSDSQACHVSEAWACGTCGVDGIKWLTGFERSTWFPGCCNFVDFSDGK